MRSTSRNLPEILTIMRTFYSRWLRGTMEANKGNRKAVLLVVLVFALGISLGSVGTYVVTTRVHAARLQQMEHNPASKMEMFTRDLNLNLEQQKQIQAILTE